MSDLDFFNPSEGGESYDPAAFDRFKEKVKKNAAFMAAARKDERRQKKKEDRLAQILVAFIKSNQRSGILLLASRCLEENIPASFILSIILLGNKEMQEQVQAELKKLAAPESEGESEALPQLPAQKEASEFSLITQFDAQDHSVPIAIKVQIDEWGKSIFEAGSAAPFRVLETSIDKEGNMKKVMIDLCANVLSDFVEAQAGPVQAYDTYFSFSEFLLRGVMNALQKQVENQKELGGASQI